MPSPTLPAWLEHFADILDAKSSKQFRKAYAGRSSVPEFLTRIIRPHLYDEASYICLARRKNVPGRNHFHSKFFDQRISDGNHQIDDLMRMTFFANPLRTVPSTDPQFSSPSERVIIRGPHVFTFEFDVDDLRFIETQLNWFRPRDSTKPLTCKIGSLYKKLSKYIDFQGITVAWSGNKSFHLHIAFETSLTLAQCSALAVCDPRQGFASYWQRLEELLMGLLDPRLVDGAAVRPDASLRFPEALRRLPGGSRMVDKASVLGIPIGTTVPQLVMWERYRKQAGSNSDLLFLSPPPFLAARHKTTKARNTHAAAVRSSSIPTHLPADELDYVTGKLKEFAPSGSYPSFERLTWTGNDGWIAYFANSEHDRNPASVMKETFSEILIQGTAPSSFVKRRLSKSLGEQIAAWREEYINDLTQPEPVIEDCETLEVEVAGKQLLGSSGVETLFTSLVSTEGVEVATQKALTKAFSESRFMVIKGPEGMRKTSTVMKMHAGLMDRLRKFNLPYLGLYAFVDYVSAEEKCAEFNRMQQDLGTNYRGIVVPSFNELYKRACKVLHTQKIDHAQAGNLGHASLWEAVAAVQPSVINWMAEFHETTWASISGFDAVFFAPHEVAHGWKFCSRSRLMWSRQYWTHLKNGVEHRDDNAKEATRLGILVHDEIDAHKLVATERGEIVDWVQELVASDPKTWRLRTSLTGTWTSFQAFIKTQGRPVVDGNIADVSFERVREIAAMGAGWEPLTLSSDGAYNDLNPEHLIYTACLDHRWSAKSRRWWRPSDPDARCKVAEWIVLLTTEELPTAVARQSDRCWSVYSLETPAPTRSVIEVFLDRSITAKRLPTTCEEYREKLGRRVQIISNSVKVLEGTRSPTSARGANGYVGGEVLQTLPFAAVELHEKMLVWNAYTGRDDCLALHHTDMINQTAGRNMGFRYQPGARHYLIANPRLFEMLLDRDAFGYLRYDLMLRLTRNQRAHIKASSPEIAEHVGVAHE